MKKIYRFAFIVLVAISGFSNRANASHLMGGEITWTCVGQDSFMVKLVVYRDCNGITLGISPINFSCATSGASITSLSIGVGTPVDITPICSKGCSRCQSPSCSFPYGIHKYSIQGIVKLSSAGNCCNIRISWAQNARNANITTSTGAGTADLYIEALLNRCLNPCDNSPEFTNAPIAILCVGQDFNLIHGVQDLDTTSGLADSLTYEWTEPLAAANIPIPYLGSYDYYKPIYFWGFPNDTLPLPRGIHLNPQSGEIKFRPMKAEVTIMVIKVNEFRNGIKIAEIRRDIQIIVITCTNNKPPSFTTTPSNIKSTAVCIGDTVRFKFQTNDPNANDTVTISWSNNINGVSWTDSNSLSKHPSAIFTWIPAANQANEQPYYFTITANDNVCPISGKYSESYEILVRNNVSGNYSVTNLGCGNYQFNAIATKGSGFPFIWSGSLNYNSTNFIHHFSKPGNYPFSFTTTSKNYCGNTIFDTIVTDTFLWLKLNNDTNICYGSSVNLNVQAYEAKGKVRYKWSTGDTVISIIVAPLKSTWYKVEVTDSLSCPAVDSVYIFVFPPVKVNNDTIVCNEQIVKLSASTGFSSYVWTTGETSQSISPIITNPEWYKVWATDFNNCLTTDSVFVDMYPVPLVFAGVDTSICAINGLYELKGSPDSLSGGSGFWTGIAVYQDAKKKWYFNPDSNNITNRWTYNIAYHYTDTSGCQNTDFTKFKVYKYNNINAGNYSNMCIDANPITLFGTPLGGYWLGKGVNTFMFDPRLAGAGKHILTYNINDYCVFSDTTYITVYPLPNVQLTTYNGQTEFCPTQGLIALNASPVGGNGALWSGDVEPNHTFNSNRIEGKYSIMYYFKDNNGCSNADTLFLRVSFPKITIDTTQKGICYGRSILLKAKHNFDNNILWSKDTASNGYFNGNLENSQLYFVPGQKDYNHGGFWIRVRTIGGICKADTDSIYIRTGYYPKTDFSADILSGNVPLQIYFNDLSTIQSGSITNFNWEFGDSSFSNVQNPLHTYLNAGSYDVKLTTVSDIGCQNSITKDNYIATTSSAQEDKNAVFMSLFPNPAGNYIEVSFTDMRYKISRLYIYNASGSLILVQKDLIQNSARIDIHEFKSGLYLLRVVTDHQMEYLAKFVKE